MAALALLVGCGGLAPKKTATPFPRNPTDTQGRASDRPYPEVRDSADLLFPNGENDSGLSAWPDSDRGRRREGPAWLDSNRTWGRNPAAPLRPEIRIRPRPRDLPGWVRVLLYRGAKPVNLYSIGEIDFWAQPPRPPDSGNAASAKTKPNPNTIAAPVRGKLVTLRGRITLRRVGDAIEISQGTKVLQTAVTRRMRLISTNPYNLIEVGETVYRGGMEIIADADGLMVVNVIGMEDYLRDVLPYELGTVDRDALEALKALAVVARTYAWKRMMQNPQGDFHLFADVNDQVYRGVKAEYLLSDRAVRETRGIVVTYNDSLVMPYYHSTCGGRTASRHEVWGGDSVGYLISRPDTDAVGQSYCQASKYSAWTQEWTQAQLAGILRRNLKSAGVADFPAFKTVRDIQATARASCGRIRTLRIETDKGPIWVKGDKVRWALRPADNEEKILPSAWFDIRASGAKFIAEGRAFGHGIGLCQMGAIGRARADQDFVQIIDAYYQGVQMVEIR